MRFGPVDIDAALHVGDHLVQLRPARLKPDVGNADDRYAAPAIRPIGATRSRVPDFRRHLPIRAVPDKDPFPNDVPPLAGDPIVVIACSG